MSRITVIRNIDAPISKGDDHKGSCEGHGFGKNLLREMIAVLPLNYVFPPSNSSTDLLINFWGE